MGWSTVGHGRASALVKSFEAIVKSLIFTIGAPQIYSRAPKIYSVPPIFMPTPAYAVGPLKRFQFHNLYVISLLL